MCFSANALVSLLNGMHYVYKKIKMNYQVVLKSAFLIHYENVSAFKAVVSRSGISHYFILWSICPSLGLPIKLTLRISYGHIVLPGLDRWIFYLFFLCLFLCLCLHSSFKSIFISCLLRSGDALGTREKMLNNHLQTSTHQLALMLANFSMASWGSTYLGSNIPMLDHFGLFMHMRAWSKQLHLFFLI